MPDVTGTIRSVTLDGVSLDAMADTNISEIGSLFLNESIPTSGRNMRKMTKRSENREGVVVACNGFERDILKALSERPTSFPMNYVTAAGDTFTANGWIEFETRETEELRAAIQMHPDKDWTQFIAD